MKQKQSAHLQHTIIIYCAIGIFVIGAIVAVAGISPLYNRLKTEQQRNLSFAVHTRAMAIAQYLNRSKDIALQVTSRTKIRLKLEAYNRGEVSRQEVVSFSKKLLGDAMNKLDELVAITRLDAKNRLVLEVGQNIPKNVWQIPTAINNDPLLEGPVKLENQEYLVVGAPILSRSGKRVGTDIVMFTLTNLKNIISDYTGLGDTGESVLGLLQENNFRSMFAMRNTMPDSDTSVDPKSSVGLAMEKALDNKSGILISKSKQKTPVLVAYAPVKDGDWALIVKMDKQELYGPINDQITTVVTIILVLILLGTVGMVLLLRPLTGKIIIQADELQKEINEKTADLQKNQQRLEKANRELDQFAYITSHDLKAPLRAIANLSEWIEEDIKDKLEDVNKKQMALMRSRVHRLENLIEGILQYSRVGRDKVTIEEFDSGILVNDIVESLSPPREFTFTVDENMPTLVTSKVRFSQVMSNLIGNAIKYHNRSDGKIIIKFFDNDEKFYEFSVEDDGPGISSNYHERIFIIFQTLQSRDDIESTGIGLTIVKKIVEEEGGKISLKSELGQGALFQFTWPKPMANKDQLDIAEA